MLCLANLFNCSPRALHPSVMSSSRVKWSCVSWKSVEWIKILSLLFHVYCTTLKSLHFWRSLARQRTSSAVEHSTVSKLGMKLVWESFFVPLIVLNISIPPNMMAKSKMYFQHFYFTTKKDLIMLSISFWRTACEENLLIISLPALAEKILWISWYQWNQQRIQGKHKKETKPHLL